MSDTRVAIVGAGWSGLACAVTLAQSGLRPCLIDAAAHPGGRARRVTWHLDGREFPLDNGQHILLGAYRDTLALMGLVGVDAGEVLLRRPFALAYADGWQLDTADIPAPWHLLAGLVRARGLTVTERLALMRWHASQVLKRWRPSSPDVAASELFSTCPPALVERLWRPLCLAALNVEPSQASASVMLRVLGDSLGGPSAASHLLIPRTDLSTVFPDAALRWLTVRGANWLGHRPVRALTQQASGAWQVHCREDTLVADAVVLALGPDRAAAILERSTTADLAWQLPTVTLCRQLQHAPISTIYLRYGAGPALSHPMICLRDDPRRGWFGQWAFDRACPGGDDTRVVSVIISGAGAHLDLAPAHLCQAIAAQLREQLGLGEPLDSRCLTDRRATLVPAPGWQRPACEPGPAGLYLAGDTAHSPYPSTLEGSVRSGIEAAQAILRRWPPASDDGVTSDDEE